VKPKLVKFNEEHLKLIEKLVDEGRYSSVSEFIRIAVAEKLIKEGCMRDLVVERRQGSHPTSS